MSALEELSDKLSEVYDLELVEELTKIFNNVVDAYKELDDAYRRETVKSEALEKYSGVGKEMYREKCEELGEVEREKKQAEYDRDYYEKYSRELLCEINRGELLRDKQGKNYSVINRE